MKKYFNYDFNGHINCSTAAFNKACKGIAPYYEELASLLKDWPKAEIVKKESGKQSFKTCNLENIVLYVSVFHGDEGIAELMRNAKNANIRKKNFMYIRSYFIDRYGMEITEAGKYEDAFKSAESKLSTKENSTEIVMKNEKTIKEIKKLLAWKKAESALDEKTEEKNKPSADEQKEENKSSADEQKEIPNDEESTEIENEAA